MRSGSCSPRPSVVLSIATCAVLQAASCQATEGPSEPVAQAPEPSAVALFESAERHFRERAYARAEELFELAAWLAESEGNRRLLVESCAMAARCFRVLGNPERGMPWLARAIDLARESEPLGYSRMLQVRGIYEHGFGEGEAATETFVELYTFCELRGLTLRAIDAAHRLARVTEPEEQEKWARRGLTAAASLGPEGDRWQALLWNNLGITYEALDRPEDVLDAYVQAREFARRVGDEGQELKADWSVGRGYRLNGEYDAAHSHASYVLRHAEARAGTEGGRAWREWVGYALSELGEIEAARGATSEALDYLHRARIELDAAGVDRSWPEGVRALEARIDELEAEL